MEISDSENSDNEPMTPPELSKETEESAEATEADPGQHIIPEYSREKYFRAYEVFKEWQMKHGHDEVTEAVMMEFFEELNETKKPSTLWSQYSMLKSTFNLKEDLDISQFKKLRAYLKKQGTGFRNAKSKVLTAANIHDFLIKASDYEFLAEKVIMIFGVVGACRKSEIVDLTLSDILDTGTSLVVTIQATPRRQMRKFTIDGDLYKVVKKYMALRPEHAKINRLLLNYQKGKCTQQPIGVNKVGGIPRRIASYLELPEADKYTGHCFRRTSAELLSQSGANVVHVIAGWKANKSSGKSDNSLQFYSQMEASNILKMSDIQQPQSHPSTQIIINQIPINQQVGGRQFQVNQGQIITTPKRLYTTVGQLINNAGKLVNINNTGQLNNSQGQLVENSGQVNNNSNASQGRLDDNQQVDNVQHANREKITMKSTGHLQRVQINKQINVVQKPKTSVDDLEASLQVILILGFCGAMRCKELCHLNLNDVEDVGTKFIVSVQDNKNFYPRTFVIMNQYYNLVKKYIALRPENCTNERFLLCYKSGYCIRQPIGKNKISVVPQNVARFLNLPNPPAYTGHCFRRTSTTLLANAGASTIHPPAKRARFSGGSSNQNLQNPQPSTSTVKFINELKNDEDSVPSPTHSIEEIKKLDSDVPFESRSNNNPNFWLTAEPIKQNQEPIKGTKETLNLDGFKFVVVEIDRRIEVVQKGWSPPEGAEYVKPHAIFDSYKSASDYADTINVKKTTRVAPPVAPSPKVISIDADSSNCPESGLPIKPINAVKNKVAPTSTPSGSFTPKRIIGTLVKKNNNNQSISVTSANGLKNIVKNRRFIGTLVNKNLNKNSIVSIKQKVDSQNAKSDFKMSNTIVQETTTLKSKIAVKIWAKIPAEYNHECKAETKNIFEETEKQEPINFILQENSTTDIEEKSVGCSQMFSESHKALEKSINLEPTCSRSIDVQAKVYDKNFLLKLPKKKPKTAAERNREYRARKKALKNAKNLGLTSDVQENCLLYLKKKMKTPADRSREYRARQKVLKKITTCSELIAINSEANQENSDGQKKSKIVSQNSILKNLLTGSFSTNNPSDKKIHKNFENKFINVPKILGDFCSVCDNLCVKEDVKSAPKRHKLILSKILPLTSIEKIFLCTTCLKSFDNYRIPKMSSVRRRIKSPEIPDRLPPVDILSGCVNGNVFIVVEKVDNSSNVITGDVSDNANPPMQVDTKDPTLTSTMSDSNSLEGPTINENLDIKEEYVNEELLEEEELMAVDPLAI